MSQRRKDAARMAVRLRREAGARGRRVRWRRRPPPSAKPLRPCAPDSPAAAPELLQRFLRPEAQPGPGAGGAQQARQAHDRKHGRRQLRPVRQRLVALERQDDEHEGDPGQRAVQPSAQVVDLGVQQRRLSACARWGGWGDKSGQRFISAGLGPLLPAGADLTRRPFTHKRRAAAVTAAAAART